MTRIVCAAPQPRAGAWLLAALLGVVAVPDAGAQTPPPVPPATSAPTPPPNFVYTVDGRRDPFTNLLDRGDPGSGGPAMIRGDGASSLSVEELVVRGVMQSRGTLIAMVSGPSGKMFSVKAGDRLADGVIRSVDQQGLVIVQRINDPLSLEKQREVRKLLRGTEGVK